MKFHPTYICSGTYFSNKAADGCELPCVRCVKMFPDAVLTALDAGWHCPECADEVAREADTSRFETNLCGGECTHCKRDFTAGQLFETETGWNCVRCVDPADKILKLSVFEPMARALRDGFAGFREVYGKKI